MVSTFYPPFSFGGDAISVQRLSRALVRRGHEVTVVHDVDAYQVLHQGPMPPLRKEDEDQGVRVIRLKSRWGPVSSLLVHQLGRPVVHTRRLRGLFRSGRFDVVTFHNPSLIGGPGILAWPEHAVTVYMAHEHWLICPTHVLWRHKKEPCDRRECLRCVAAYHRPPQVWRYTGAIARALRQVDVLIALSEFSREKHRAFGLERQMTVLPNFVPDRSDEPPISAVSPHPRPYFLFAGRLELIKGLDDVLPVFRSIPEADLLVAGEGSHGPSLHRISAGQTNVHFLGRLDQATLSRFYRHAVAAVVPSVCYEIFPLVLIEALREGTPIVVRRIGPGPEIISASGAGETFSSPDDLVGILKRLVHDREYRNSLGLKAIQAVNERWTEAVVVPQFLDLVRSAARRRGPPIGATTANTLAPSGTVSV